MHVIDRETVNDLLDWPMVVAALRAGHLGGRPQIKDVLMRDEPGAFLTRVAWLPGNALGLKSVTVFPQNTARTPPRPAVQGQFLLFDPQTGAVGAVIDGVAITAWKTAGDSALGADLLARRDVETFVILGAGAMAEPLIRAHLSVRPSLKHIIIANRTRARADTLKERLADLGRDVRVSDDFSAASDGDVVCTATMSSDPVLRGTWLKPGAHVDLVGAYTPDMREADDEVLRRGRLFVDARETTLHEIGELMMPLASGAISEADIVGDLFDLVPASSDGTSARRSAEEITVFKNGGGAHLDLMTAGAIHAAFLKSGAV